MTTKKPIRLKVGRAKRSIGLTTKPGDLKVRRRKGKLIVVRDLKNEPWYASAAIQIGIRPPMRDKPSSVADSQKS
jgi:hypothetical protein